MASFHLPDHCGFPGYLVLVQPGVFINYNPIVNGVMLYVLLSCAYSLLQGSSCVSNVHMWTILACHFLDEDITLASFTVLTPSAWSAHLLFDIYLGLEAGCLAKVPWWTT